MLFRSALGRWREAPEGISLPGIRGGIVPIISYEKEAGFVSDRQKGILYLILSAFFFAAMNMFVKLSGDLPTFQKVFSATQSRLYLLLLF